MLIVAVVRGSLSPAVRARVDDDIGIVQSAEGRESQRSQYRKYDHTLAQHEPADQGTQHRPNGRPHQELQKVSLDGFIPSSPRAGPYDKSEKEPEWFSNVCNIL